jgi:GT2 family glycosyltransferase
MDVVIVNYNTREYLRACLGSLSGADGTIIVVDNASSDGSAAMVKAEYPRVVLVANSRNLGYGAAANQGIALSQSRAVLLLNGDTQLMPGTLQHLESYLHDHPHVAIVGPLLVSPSGQHQSSCRTFPGLLATILEEGALGPLLRHVPFLREMYPPTASHTKPRGVAWVQGAAMAIRRSAFDAAGGFDPDFFMYFEEVDLCYRLAASGWDVHFAPLGPVVHVGGASARQRRADMAVQIFASRLLFYRKHYSRVRQVMVISVIYWIALARLVVSPLRIRLARDELRSGQLREEAAAWRRVLHGDWLQPLVGRSVSSMEPS